MGACVCVCVRTRSLYCPRRNFSHWKSFYSRKKETFDRVAPPSLSQSLSLMSVLVELLHKFVRAAFLPPSLNV